MKKFFCVILAVLLAVSFAGCSSEEKDVSNKNSQNNTIADKDSNDLTTPKFLIDADWKRWDDNIGENVGITFAKDGSFFYNCDCGEPIGNSDLYDRYSYDEKTNSITLYACDDSADVVVPIVYCDEFSLVLHMDEGIVDFENYNMHEGFEISEGAKRYLVDHAASVTVLKLDFENKIITTAPSNYDADAKKQFEDKIGSLKLADDVQLYYLYVTVEQDVETELEYGRVPEEDYQYVGEYYTNARIRFNLDYKVDSLLFFSQTNIM